MAWPLSRYIDYLVGTVPRIGAAFLNSVQDKIVGIYTGGLTLKAVTVDGTGANSATPTAGWISASVGVVAAVLKATQAMGTTSGATGVLYAELVPFAAGKIKGSDGSVLLGRNVASVTRTGAGYYQVTLRSCPAAYSALADNTAVDVPILVTYAHSSSLVEAVPTALNCKKITSGGNAALYFEIYLSDGAAGVDRNVSFLVFP